MGRFENIDDINKFAGTLYGGNIRDYYMNDSFWLDSIFGVTASNFETDMILDGDNVVYNPSGISIYSALDAGLKFDFYNNFYFAPFIGFTGDYEKVLHQNDSSIAGRTGSAFGFSEETLGIRNDYQVFLNIQTNNIQTLGIRMNFWSIADDAGGSVSYAISNDEYGLNHKLVAELKFIF
ncbi:MAG: autotransporter domain-containing protein [Alphaproteobacteria bacterium]|nr:autotransporter domain-containing protein [Alphaproteobacteria bacterium]MBN2675185.1 autotransporter domain-containing protein [Alphaproteobacteria bacterium]